MKEATFSDRYKWFLGLLAVLTVISLIVMNEFTTIIESQEAFNILHVQNQIGEKAVPSVAPFPNTSQFIIYKLFGFSPFWMRMSNVIVFLLLLLGIRVWCGKIFGKEQAITFITTIVSSFLLISMSKFAVADIPLAAFHMMIFAFLVICLKQPKVKWQIVYGLFVMGSFLVNPTSGVIYGIGLLSYMLIFHKNSKNLRQPLIFGIWAFFIILFFFLGGFSWGTDGFVFPFQSSWKQYFIWQLIGLLPWFGFLPAALWDLFQKLKKKEEMAIILFGWLLFSLISHGLVLQLCLLFLISKQLNNYFKPNYPYKDLVKTFSIINLVFTFFALLAIMFGGFAALHTTGFRSAAVFSGMYWVLSFIGILGLFSNSRKYVLGGFGIAGAFSLMLFWVQINPIVNRFRDINVQLLDRVEELEKGKQMETTGVEVSQPLFGLNQFKAYSNASGFFYGAFENKSDKTKYYLLDDTDYQLFLKDNKSEISVDSIRGGIQVFQKPELFYVIRKN